MPTVEPRTGADRPPEPAHEGGHGPGGRGLGILLRVVAFVAVVAVGYLVFQRATHWLFAPSLAALGVTVPSGEMVPGHPVILRAAVTNEKGLEGNGFVVAALPGGRQVEGPSFRIPQGDTVLLPVAVSLGPGSHVVSLVVFDAWRGIRRLESFSGLILRFGPQDIEIRDLVLPERTGAGEAIQVAFTGINPTASPDTLVPVLLFQPDGVEGAPIEVEGPAREVAGGGATALAFRVNPRLIPPGRYFVRLRLRRAGGERAGQSLYPVPMEIVG